MSVSKPKYYRIGENGERIEIEGPLTPSKPITSHLQSTVASPNPRVLMESNLSASRANLYNLSPQPIHIPITYA